MTKYSLFLILACMMSMFFLLSCEKAEIYKTYVQPTYDNPILTRGDCDDCPDEDECCCYVALDNSDTHAQLYLCGTSDGTTAGGSCPSVPCLITSFTQLQHTPTLTTPFNFKYNFCAMESTEFFIMNTHATDPADVKVSCTRGQGMPQEYSFSLAANGGRKYLLTDEDCVVTECP
jgi:hypothetical protein